MCLGDITSYLSPQSHKSPLITPSDYNGVPLLLLLLLPADINVVNGVPFPQLNLPAAWVRLTFLNGANARPYNIQLKQRVGDTNTLVDLTNRCWVVASDSGEWATQPAQLGPQGLYLAVAYR